MKFKVTLAVICVILLLLGAEDLRVALKNLTPTSTTLDEMLNTPPKVDWLQIENVSLDWENTVSSSGTIEVEALLIPLLSASKTDAHKKALWVLESRSPELIAFFSQYHFVLNTPEEKKAFFASQSHLWEAPRNIKGMRPSSLIQKPNKQKLVQILKDSGIQTTEIEFITEGKEPNLIRGIFFFVIALAGLGKLFGAKLFARN